MRTFKIYSVFNFQLYTIVLLPRDFRSGSVVKNLPAVQETQEIWVQSLGKEDLLEMGMANPLQYSYLENAMDRGAWRAIVS